MHLILKFSSINLSFSTKFSLGSCSGGKNFKKLPLQEASSKTCGRRTFGQKAHLMEPMMLQPILASPHGCGALDLMTLNIENCPLTATENLSQGPSGPTTTTTTTVRPYRLRAKKTHFRAWQRRRNRTDTKLRSSCKMLSKTLPSPVPSW